MQGFKLLSVSGLLLATLTTSTLAYMVAPNLDGEQDLNEVQQQADFSMELDTDEGMTQDADEGMTQDTEEGMTQDMDEGIIQDMDEETIQETEVEEMDDADVQGQKYFPLKL